MEVGPGRQLRLSVCGQPLVMAIESCLSNMNRAIGFGSGPGGNGCSSDVLISAVLTKRSCLLARIRRGTLVKSGWRITFPGQREMKREREREL